MAPSHDPSRRTLSYSQDRSAETKGFQPYSGLMQLAYVTPDLDRAIEMFAQAYGVPQFLLVEGLVGVRPTGESFTFRIALAYVGETQLELIEPTGGDDALYREMLPTDGSIVRFHHMAHLVESEEAFERLVRILAGQEIRIAQDNSQDGLSRVLYTDHRATLGHYLEHLYFTETGIQVFARVPRFPGAPRRDLALTPVPLRQR